MIFSGQTVRVALNSAAVAGTQSSATLTIGGVNATFLVTTAVPSGTAALFYVSQSGDYIGQG